MDQALFEVMAELHRIQNEYTSEYNQTGKVFSMGCSSVVAIATSRVTIRLKETLPPTEFDELSYWLRANHPLESYAYDAKKG